MNSQADTNPTPCLKVFEYYAKASRCAVEISIPEEWAVELEAHSLSISPMLADLVTELGSQGKLFRADFPKNWREIRHFSLPWKKGTKLRPWKETLPAYLVNFIHAAALSCEVRPDEIVWRILARQLPLYSNLPPLKKSYRKKGITRKTAIAQSSLPANVITFSTSNA